MSECVIHIKYADGYSPHTRESRYPHDYIGQEWLSHEDSYREMVARLLAGEKFVRLPGGALINVNGVKAIWKTNASKP